MKTIAFVCTGNTCRSPMAEYIMKDKLDKKGITGYVVKSFGIVAWDNSPINTLAYNELQNRGIKKINHVATRLTDKQQKECDLIITMTKEHLEALGKIQNAKTIASLTGCKDIADPYGGSPEDYHNCADQIEKAINVLIDKLAIILDNR